MPSSARRPVKPRPRSARSDGVATRGQILQVAGRIFAEKGFERATSREICTTAGINMAAVNYHFGGKDGLFAAALKDSIRPDGIFQWDRKSFGMDIAKMMANHAHESNDRMHAFQFLLRAVTSPATAPLLSAAVQERFLGPIREWIGGEQAPARARLLAATFIGLLVERLIRDEPLLGEEREQFIEHTGAMLQALVEKS